MRQKLESISSLLDRYLNRGDSELPTVILQVYESNEPIRLEAEVIRHSGMQMALIVGRAVEVGQRVSVLISISTIGGDSGTEEEVSIEASGTVISAAALDSTGNFFQVSIQMKGRYGVEIDKESSRRKK